MKACSFKTGNEVLVLMLTTAEACCGKLRVDNKVKALYANHYKRYIWHEDPAVNQQLTITNDDSNMDSFLAHMIENAAAAII